MNVERIEAILKWAHAHHWTFLRVQGEVSGTSEPIRYGEGLWKNALVSANSEMIARIEARIERWNELEQGSRV